MKILKSASEFQSQLVVFRIPKSTILLQIIQIIYMTIGNQLVGFGILN